MADDDAMDEFAYMDADFVDRVPTPESTSVGVAQVMLVTDDGASVHTMIVFSYKLDDGTEHHVKLFRDSALMYADAVREVYANEDAAAGSSGGA